MANGFISVDTDTVRSVAGACQRVQGELQNCAGQLQSQLGTLQGALQGPAAQAFEEKFDAWVKTVHDMVNTIGQTAKTLNTVADQATTEIQEIQQLANLQAY